jgi:hypothetical protein
VQLVEPRQLIFDIETFPMEVAVWRPWEARALEVYKYSSICSISAKWLGGKQYTMGLPDFKDGERGLMKWFWDLVNEADILIAHNGKAFDFGRINTQFLKYDFGPPSPTQKYDTKKEAKRIFGFDSNSLKDLAQFLGIGKKMATGGYELWQGCMAGDPVSWRKMKRYNAHDVKLLEAIYLKMRPWSDSLNLTLWKGSCPHCGSSKIQHRGPYRAKTRTYKRTYCHSCRGWGKVAGPIDRTDITAVPV